jgi:PrgI family protein
MGRVRIPADVEYEDRLVFGLTARQLAILAGAGVLAWLSALALRPVLALPVAAMAALPVLAAGLLLAVGQRDGLSLDRLVLAALRHARTPRRHVPAPEGIPDLPALLRAVHTPPPLAPLCLPARGVDGDGVIDLAGEGAALLCRASTVNFALRTEAEQEALVAAFALFLHALSGPIQLVVRAERIDLGSLVGELERTVGELPHLQLEQCARDHTRFLGELAGRRDVLRRELLVVLREPQPQGAGARLLRRAEEAAALLAQAGIRLTPLDQTAAIEALTRAVDPDAPHRPGRLAVPEDTITRSRS